MKQFWKRAAVAIVSLALLAGMPPAAGAASDEVEAALASMTLWEKVGQLFAVRPEALDFEQRSGGSICAPTRWAVSCCLPPIFPASPR